MWSWFKKKKPSMSSLPCVVCVSMGHGELEWFRVEGAVEMLYTVDVLHGTCRSFVNAEGMLIAEFSDVRAVITLDADSGRYATPCTPEGKIYAPTEKTSFEAAPESAKTSKGKASKKERAKKEEGK